jgi:ketosteroid isomerase-like protein
VNYRCLAAVVSLTLVLAGCATGSLESYKAKDHDETLIVATLMKIPNGVKAKSVDLLMQAYADDLYVANFNKYLGVATDPSVVRIGKRELRQAYIQTFRAVKEISMEVKDFRLIVQGDRAVAEGNTELLVKVEAGRREARENLVRNEVTWRLKRGPMGWRVQEEIFH